MGGRFCLPEGLGHGPLRPMSAIDTETLLSQLKWRYATKQFDPTKKIDPATWAALEEVLILSPSSFGLQPWRFYVITDRELKEKLVPLSWDNANWPTPRMSSSFREAPYLS